MTRREEGREPTTSPSDSTFSILTPLFTQGVRQSLKDLSLSIYPLVFMCWSSPLQVLTITTLHCSLPTIAPCITVFLLAFPCVKSYGTLTQLLNS